MLKDNEKNNKNCSSKKIELTDIFIFCTIIIMFVISLLSFFPGLVTSDNVDQINQAFNNNYVSAHPVIHSMFIGLLTRLGGQGAIWIPGLVQIFFFAFAWTYICKEFRKYNPSAKNKLYQWIVTLIIVILPLNFLYSITLWKDIIYSYNFILLVGFIYIGIKEKFKYSNGQIFLISLSSVAIMKFRLNGLPIGFLTFVMLFILNIKYNKAKKQIILFVVSFIICYLLFTIPTKFVYIQPSKKSEENILTSTKVYSFGALLNDGIEIDEEDKEFLNQIINLDDWKNLYDPVNGTEMLFSEKYHRDIWKKEGSIKRFNELYSKYTKQKPMTIIKHFLSVNSIWWSVKEYGPMHSIIINNGSVSEMSNHIYDNHPIWNHGNEKLSDWAIESLNGKKYDVIYRPAFAAIVSIIIVVAISIKNKNGWMFLTLIPALLNTGTYVLLLSSQDARYFYPTQITSYILILAFGVEFLKTTEKLKQNNKKGKKANSKTLVIVPAYNEALNLKKTINDITNNSKFDYLIVNDCSKDDTIKVCEQNNFNYISLPVNYGLSSGIQVGMKYALQHGYDVVIQFDGDGQHEGKFLKTLSNSVAKGECDIAIGSRFVTKKKPKTIRMFGSNLISLCLKLTTGEKISDPTSGYRAYSRDIIEMFTKDSSLTPEPDTIAYLIKRGYKVKEFQVEMREREFGESYLKPFKAAQYMCNIIFSILLFRNFD